MFKRLDRLFDTSAFRWVRAHRPLVAGFVVAVALAAGAAGAQLLAEDCDAQLRLSLIMNADWYEQCKIDHNSSVGQLGCRMGFDQMNSMSWNLYYLCRIGV